MNKAIGIDILDECEKKLRLAVAEAAADGDYGGVHRVSNWAQAIAAMIASTEIQPSSSPLASSAINTPIMRSASWTKASPDAVVYPQFFRRGDELVKVGWSKKERKGYNHRAPKLAVTELLSVIKKVAAKKDIFTSDDLLPLKNPLDGGIFPGYQVFVALAWLRSLGLVQQHGRKGGYTLVVNRPIDEIISTEWDSLRDWRG